MKSQHRIVSMVLPQLEMAPLQGLTGHVFRRVYLRHFAGVDRTFCPFVRLKAGQLRSRDERELEAGRGEGPGFTPQILASETEEARRLSGLLRERGFSRVNLNLGCPYPMETRRGKGAGLLPHPERVAALLEVLCGELQVSVKTRLGLEGAEEFAALVPVFNDFPLDAVIVHPRTARQMVEGEVRWDVFGEQARRLTAPVFANGDILTAEDARWLRGQFPWIAGWMIGRGLLRDPFLPARIKGLDLPQDEKAVLRRFLDDLAEEYARKGLSPHHVLDKLKALWAFLAFGFPDGGRLSRRFKKLGGLGRYRDLVDFVLR